MQIVSPFQIKLLKEFVQLSDSTAFHFTGGTALSLFYLKHRRSEDLDFFTSTEGVLLPFAQQLQKRMETLGYKAVLERGFHTFAELKVSNDQETVIFHLALDAAFQIEPFVEFPEYLGLKINSLTDTATNKLLALFGRAALRDFIDVYYLVQTGRFTKKQLLDYAKQKDPGFDLYWLAIAFERLQLYQQKDYDLSLLFEPLSDKTLAAFFSQWRKEIADSLV